MKIDLGIMGSTPPNIGFKNKTDINFERLLNSPAKQSSGDEYYWQHQSDLQQSALTFTASQHASKDELQTFVQEEISFKQSILDQTINKPAAAIAPANIITLKPAQASNNELAKLDTPLPKPNEEKTAMIMDTIKPISNTKNGRTLTVSNKPLLPHSKYKNHQLYLDQNTAELSINTNQLNKTETQELKQLVKQWLTRKGLALKQMLINGEEQ